MAIIEIMSGKISTHVKNNTPTHNVNENDNNDKKFDVTLSEVSGSAQVSSTRAANSVDTVVISNAISELRANLNAANENHEAGIDMEKVMRIQRQLKEGSYHINPDRIAAKMMQFEFL